MNTDVVTGARERSPVAEQPRVRRWPWILLRVLLCVLAVDVLAQAVLAGRFLSGDFASLTAHEFNGSKIAGSLSFVLIAVAIVAWRVGGGPGWLVPVTVVLSGAVAGQIALGFSHVLGVHIPLGVTIIGLTGWLAVWVCTHQPTDRPFARRPGARS
jgi:hypothetical protein